MARNKKASRRAVRIVWYTPENYPRCRVIFDDAADLPDTFDQWLAQTELLTQRLRKQEIQVVRAMIDPESFPAWCALNGHPKIDHAARSRFASVKAMESQQS